jgi:lipopolysaccharide/colanic/teichoic acid biosynthesis glycosyltransferase
VAISDETRIGGGTLTALPRGRPDVADTAPAISARRARSLRRWQFAADLTAVGFAVGVTVVAWNLYGPGHAAPQTIEVFAVFALVSMLVTAMRTRMSAVTVKRVLTSNAGRLLQMALDAALAGVILLVVALSGMFGTPLPLLPIITFAVASFVLLPLGRIVAREISEPVRIVLVGSGPFAVELRERLSKARRVELTTVLSSAASAFADSRAVQLVCDRYEADGLLVVIADAVPDAARAQPFLRLAAEQTLKPDAGPDSRPEVNDLLAISHRLPVSVAIQLSDGGNLPIFQVGGRPSRLVRLIKRGFDVIISASALLVLSPLLLLLMIFVGIESGVPLLFRQRRLGHGKEPFHILKLRTMRSTTGGHLHAAGPRTPLSHPADPMLVTRVGAVLRRTSLDEIPQLVNVLRGEMSLVGPRPFVPEECEALPAWAAPRFSTRPGLTGMWQVCGQHTVSVDELCWLDLFYVSCWTLAADLRVVLLTPARVLRGSRGSR